ncbi:MAG: YibE/F family protein [Solirubrobacteraceae bacterium]|nr:YibE/F family protein [Solirubrobacteraceae bacterium]
MTDEHDHDHPSPGRGDALRALLSSPGGRGLVGFVSLLLVLTAVGLVALWPDGDRPRVEGAGGPTVSGEVVGVRLAPCGGPTDQRCRTVVARVTEGEDEGHEAEIVLGPPEVSPDLDVGDAIRLARQAPLEGEAADALDDPPAGDAGGPGAATSPAPAYSYAERDRRAPLVWLGVLFAVLGLVVARSRGALALLGTGASITLVVVWLVPALLSDHPPVLVALVGAFAVMFITTGLTYGVTTQSLAAVTGIGLSLLVALGVGVLWSELAHLDGTGGELGAFVIQSGSPLGLGGIVLAGMVIGALGVLTDTVVSQVSTVAALHRANDRMGVRRLYREAFAVGRDHLAATIHTLVLAYAGATLPLLLVVSANGVGVGDAFNDPDLAEPVVATLVGSIALVVAVPLSTLLAALLVRRVPRDALDGGHAHHH